MLLIVLLGAALAVSGAPQAQNATSTCTNSYTTTLFTAPATTPTAAYTVFGNRQGNEVVHQYWNAVNERFYLGGSPSSYCPFVAQQEGGCPPGNVTVFVGLVSLDSAVPGGQIVYVALEGWLGFTQAHSASYPEGAVVGSFTYFQAGYDQFGYLSTNAFGARGFMACPTRYGGGYQIYAAFANASVPNGEISDCIGLDAITEVYSTNTKGAAAWEYT